MTLDGRCGIITGGASGIGFATAHALIQLGARLVIADIQAESATQAADQLGAAVPVAANVTDFHAMELVRDTCLRAYGKVDFLVACAGIGDASSLAEGDPEHWRTVIETNVLGVAYAVRSVLPTMQQQGSGHVVILASVSGRETYVGEPIYIASKWAVVGLAHALRKEALRSNVRVTLIEPGLVDTPMARANPFAQTWLDQFAPLQPEDVARTVVYALQQPPHMAINEIVLRPLVQEV